MKLLDIETAGVNQLIDAPDKYPYALWKEGKGNNWDPTSITSMLSDIQQWKAKDILSADERLLVKRLLGFFSVGESLVNNNLMLSISRFVTDGACRQYIARQIFEESLHNSTMEVCCEAYNLDINEVANAYKNIPAIKAKTEFMMKVTSDLNRRDFDITTIEGKREFITNVFVFYIICEGMYFYSGFAKAMALGRQNKMIGLCDQIRYTLRDETVHIKFGVYLLNRLRREYPEVWTYEFETELFKILEEAVRLEIIAAKDELPNGILGLNADMFVFYTQYIANRRMESINLPFRFPADKNPFPWLSETMDAPVMGAFFERHEREYQQASALEDDL
jgi:ribonucleoside-diphosphate reductase beta chain